MVRMSCLLGSPMITQEPGRSWPRQPGRAELQRLQASRGRRRSRGGAVGEDQTPRLLDFAQPPPPPTAAAHALLALLAQIPPQRGMRMRRGSARLQALTWVLLWAVLVAGGPWSGLCARSRLAEAPLPRMTQSLPRPQSGGATTPSGKGENCRARASPSVFLTA